jgi:hypothetical protein
VTFELTIASQIDSFTSRNTILESFHYRDWQDSAGNPDVSPLSPRGSPPVLSPTPLSPLPQSPFFQISPKPDESPATHMKHYVAQLNSFSLSQPMNKKQIAFSDSVDNISGMPDVIPTSQTDSPSISKLSSNSKGLTKGSRPVHLTKLSIPAVTSQDSPVRWTPRALSMRLTTKLRSPVAFKSPLSSPRDTPTPPSLQSSPSRLPGHSLLSTPSAHNTSYTNFMSMTPRGLSSNESCDLQLKSKSFTQTKLEERRSVELPKNEVRYEVGEKRNSLDWIRLGRILVKLDQIWSDWIRNRTKKRREITSKRV